MSGIGQVSNNLDGTNSSANSMPARRPDYLRYIPAIYLGAIWLTSSFVAPFAGFENVPFYVIFAPLMFFCLPRRIVTYAILMTLALGAYEALKAIQPGFSFSTRGLIGIPAFACIISTVFGSLEVLRSYTDKELVAWLRTILLLIFLFILAQTILSFLGFEIPTRYRNYVLGINVYSGFFLEPSHVAMALSPFIFMCIFRIDQFLKYLGPSSLFLLILLTVLCLSATIMALWALAFLMVATSRLLKGNIFYTILACTVIVAIGIVSLTVPQIYARVAGVFLNNPAMYDLSDLNGSSLAFLKGLEMTAYSAVHFPLGVAFENMSVLAPHAFVSTLSDFFYTLNSNDGTSLLFKGICELGALFVCFSVAGAFYFLRCLAWYPPAKFYSLVILCFQFVVFAHFIRATTYFAGILPIGLASLIFALLSGFDSRYGVKRAGRSHGITRYEALNERAHISR